MVKVQTLCMIHDGNRILLGMKKRGFGAGRWNGFGGKLQGDETIEQAMLREVEEEIGVKLLDHKNQGMIEFEFKGNPEKINVHLYSARTYAGEIREGEEMKPQWFDIDKIPYESMWSDDIYWLPLFLKGHKIKASFMFDDKDGVLKKDIEIF